MSPNGIKRKAIERDENNNIIGYSLYPDQPVYSNMDNGAISLRDPTLRPDIDAESDEETTTDYEDSDSSIGSLDTSDMADMSISTVDFESGGIMCPILEPHQNRSSISRPSANLNLQGDDWFSDDNSMTAQPIVSDSESLERIPQIVIEERVPDFEDNVVYIDDPDYFENLRRRCDEEERAKLHAGCAVRQPSNGYAILQNQSQFQLDIDIDDPENQCKVCGKSFDTNSRLLQHLRNRHGPCQCEVCYKPLLDPAVSDARERVHEKQGSFKCDVCQKFFMMSWSLKSHMKSHTGEMPFHCDQCDEVFSHCFELRDHLRSHTSEGPIKCNICKSCDTSDKQ